jgi:hypothetical protein
MMNEEEYIRTRISGDNPFKVPEGYFEQLTADVMSRLPERKAQHRTLFVRLRPLMYAAACLCVVIFSAAIYFNSDHDDNLNSTVAQTVAQQENVISEEYVEDAVDYVMADNNDIYACLTSE